MAERLAIPARLINGRLATVTQDSEDDVAQCLLAVARTRPGDRWDAPDMGAEPLEFAELPVDTRQLAETLRRHEPRRTIQVIQTIPALADALEQAAAELTIAIQATTTENTDG